MNDEDIDKLDKIFDSKKGFYPTLSQFFNQIKVSRNGNRLKIKALDKSVFDQSLINKNMI